MPQLNPDPWFFILLFSWLILLIMLPQKILKHTPLNRPNLKNTKFSSSTWNWPW